MQTIRHSSICQKTSHPVSYLARYSVSYHVRQPINHSDNQAVRLYALVRGDLHYDENCLSTFDIFHFSEIFRMVVGGGGGGAERAGVVLKSGVVILDTERVGLFCLSSWLGFWSIIVGTLPHSDQQHSTGICRIVFVATWGNHDQDQVLNYYEGGHVCEPSFAVVIYHGINYTHTHTHTSDS